MVLENPSTNQLRFILLTSEKEQTEHKEKDKVSYEVLGMVQRAPNTVYTKSRIAKMITVQGKVEIPGAHVEESEKRIFIVTLVLR